MINKRPYWILKFLADFDNWYALTIKVPAEKEVDKHAAIRRISYTSFDPPSPLISVRTIKDGDVRQFTIQNQMRLDTFTI